MRGAVSFDFHNTLIRCDAWFDLEVRTLPIAVARILRERSEWDGDPDEGAIAATYRELRREIIGHGNELDAANGVIETYRRLGVAAHRPTIAPIVAELFDPLVAASEPVEGARETIEFIAFRGIPVGVISSAIHHPFLEKCLERHGIRQHVAVIVTSASCGYYKSRPEIFRAAYADLGAEIENSVHIGDSFRFDHLAGRASGLRTAWFNEANAAAPAGESPPDLELTSMVGAGPRLLHLLAMATHAN
jgi:FMN phosphatase YigB (HAD superfamily)